jgi:hypothetical protein
MDVANASNLDAVYEAVKHQYFESGDFNGYPMYRLKSDFGLVESSAITIFLKALLESGKIDVVGDHANPNPHIRAFASPSRETQLRLLDLHPIGDHTCLYPSSKMLLSATETARYCDEPYKLLLANGCGQLEYKAFDLSVLEYYRNDPRYIYETDAISGHISVSN